MTKADEKIRAKILELLKLREEFEARVKTVDSEIKEIRGYCEHKELGDPQWDGDTRYRICSVCGLAL